MKNGATGALRAFGLALFLAGCAAYGDRAVPPAAPSALPSAPAAGGSTDAPALNPLTAPTPAPAAARAFTVSAVPTPPSPGAATTPRPAPSAPPNAAAVSDVTLALDQMPLPNAIQLVFGNILKLNFSVDPTLLTRTDLVTLRTSRPQPAAQVLETMVLLLKSYGIAVLDMGSGLYRIVPDTNQAAYQPEIRRGRAQPEVPPALRPVFSLVEMSSVSHTQVGNWLKAMFGNRLSVQDDSGRNALLLSGQVADVNAAMEAIQVLDQPLMRSRHSRLVSPATSGVEELARRLVEILAAEGYTAVLGPTPAAPVSLLPVPASNSLLVFASDPAVLEHVVEWAARLDSLDPGTRRTGNYFSYEVRYADAQALARTMQELMAGLAQGASEPQQVVPAGVRVIGAPPAPRQPPRIVVNPATNTLIFHSANPDDYAQILGILRTLDKPSKSALIEVTVAEVRVGDRGQLGIEWSFGPNAAGSGSITGGTGGGLGVGTSGLNLSFLNGAGVVRARLNALASDNRARILSAPRVMARNGETATIQVGQEVPIVTSQQSSGTAVAGGGNATAPGSVILQQIQYRSTGVILRVRPVIFSGRVELEVQQEVSSAAATATGVNVSPTFSTRKVDTKLSIRDGATVVLGGLISRTQSDGQAGVPLLKDLPWAGQLFRSDTRDSDETELIVLITPYVVENDLVAEQVTQAVRAQLGLLRGVPSPRTLALPPRPLGEPPPPAATSTMSRVLPPAAELRSPSGLALPQGDSPTVPVSPASPAQAVLAPVPTGRQEPAQSSPFKASDLPVGRPVTDPTLAQEIRRAAEAVAHPPGRSAGQQGATSKSQGAAQPQRKPPASARIQAPAGGASRPTP